MSTASRSGPRFDRFFLEKQPFQRHTKTQQTANEAVMDIRSCVHSYKPESTVFTFPCLHRVREIRSPWSDHLLRSSALL